MRPRPAPSSFVEPPTDDDLLEHTGDDTSSEQAHGLGTPVVEGPRTQPLPMTPQAPVESAPPAWQPSAAPGPSSPPLFASAAPPKSKKGLLVVLGVVLVVVLAAIGGIVLVSGGSSGTKYADLKVGQCFQHPGSSFTTVTVVACTKPHDLEVYAIVTDTAGPKVAFPGMNPLLQYASPLCLAQFRAYAGVPFEQLNLQDDYITPREAAWKSGVRTVVCAVAPSNGSRTSKSLTAAI
jgi:hypothetical protein